MASTRDFLCAKDNGGYALLNNEMDYLKCSSCSSIPLCLLHGENASYKLNNLGTFYIISLKADLCNDEERVMIKVENKGTTPSPDNPNQMSSSAARSSFLRINILTNGGGDLVLPMHL